MIQKDNFERIWIKEYWSKKKDSNKTTTKIDRDKMEINIDLKDDDGCFENKLVTLRKLWLANGKKMNNTAKNFTIWIKAQLKDKSKFIRNDINNKEERIIALLDKDDFKKKYESKLGKWKVENYPF